MSKIIRQLAVVLASVLFASLVVPAAAQDRLRWTDIALFDGRTLTAAELDRSTVVVQIVFDPDIGG